MPAPSQPLDIALAAARSARLETLSLIADRSQEDLDRRADDGRWSAGEVVDHLIRTDATYADEIRTLVERARNGRRFLMRGLGRFFTIPTWIKPLVWLLDWPLAAVNALAPTAVRRALFATRRVKLPAPPAFMPTRRAKSDLMADLEAYLDRLDQLASEDFGGVAPENIRYLNPALGLTTLPGAIDLLARHERRHQEQLREALDGSR